MEVKLRPYRVFVKFPLKDLDESFLVQLFSQFGQITKAEVIRDILGCPKGFAYLTFSEDKCYERALALNGMVIYGRKIRVEPATEPSDTIRNKITCPRTFAILEVRMSHDMSNYLKR